MQFNVYHQAQTVLFGVHKRNMDPFKRKNKNAGSDGEGFLWGYGDKKRVVSVCELMFFRWALQNKVLQYAMEHEEEIKADMQKISRIKRQVKNRSSGGENLQPALAAEQVSEVVVDMVLVESKTRDPYWKDALEEKMQRPRKRRKRFRQCSVGMDIHTECDVRV